jgi:hypothetical protein
MTYQVKPGDLFGRVGSDIGKGLAEQLPQEIKNQRLASGLENIGKEKNPIAQMQQLYRSGASAQDVAQLLPQIQSATQKEAYLARQQGAPQQRAQAPNMAETAKATPGKAATAEASKGGFATPSQIKQYKESLLQEPSYQDISSMARDILESGITQDPNVAEAMAEKQIKQDLSAQRNKVTQFENDLNKRLDFNLQKGGLGNFQDVPGEIQQKLLDQGSYLIGKGLSPEAVSQQMDQIATELGKIATQTNTTGSIPNWFSPSTEKIRQLKDQKKKYEEFGFGEQFDDIASSALGITPMQAAAVLDPLKNAEIEKAIKPHTSKLRFEPQKLKEKDLDAIINDIKPEDNLLSVAEKLRSGMIDVNQFFERLSQLEDEGKKALTEQQKRQRNKPSNNSIMGDILFKVF